MRHRLSHKYRVLVRDERGRIVMNACENDLLDAAYAARSCYDCYMVLYEKAPGKITIHWTDDGKKQHAEYVNAPCKENEK